MCNTWKCYLFSVLANDVENSSNEYNLIYARYDESAKFAPWTILQERQPAQESKRLKDFARFSVSAARSSQLAIR